MEMYKYKKAVNITYFEKLYRVNIDEVPDNAIIYLKVRSSLSYGVREWNYYGRLVKRTPQFFDVLEYTTGFNEMHTEFKNKLENNPKKYTKRWAKKSIIEIYLAKTKEVSEVREYETNNIKYAKSTVK